MKISPNGKVRCVLTEYGASMLNDRNDNIRAQYKLSQKFPRYCNGDTYETELWWLMSEFGPYFSACAEFPFVYFEIVGEMK